MAKLFSKMKIIRTVDGKEEVIPMKTVFDATPAEAKQFDALKSARPATAEEIKAHAEKVAMAKGQAFTEAATAEPATQAAKLPDSGAAGDPNSAPKGKNG